MWSRTATATGTGPPPDAFPSLKSMPRDNTSDGLILPPQLKFESEARARATLRRLTDAAFRIDTPVKAEGVLAGMMFANKYNSGAVSRVLVWGEGVCWGE